MIRAFIAIDLPGSLRNDLERLQDGLRAIGAPVSWVRPASIHLTLKFLGNIEHAKVPLIGEELAEIAARQTPFRLQPKACGAFPTLKQMRVLWVGLNGDVDILRSLQERIDSSLGALGFQPEKRPFRGHLTLGRVKTRKPVPALQKALLDQQDFRSEAFDVTGLVLYKSDLSPKGAHYTVLDRAAFSE